MVLSVGMHLPADDDTFMEDSLDLQECLISEVGIIWRGTVSSPTPHPWEYGQVCVCALTVSAALM